jgi:hypothetical protein
MSALPRRIPAAGRISLAVLAATQTLGAGAFACRPPAAPRELLVTGVDYAFEMHDAVTPGPVALVAMSSRSSMAAWGS